MKYKHKCVFVGLIGGGMILPALLHPIKITVLASVEDIINHAIGGLIGTFIGLVICKTKKQSR